MKYLLISLILLSCITNADTSDTKRYRVDVDYNTSAKITFEQEFLNEFETLNIYEYSNGELVSSPVLVINKAEITDSLLLITKADVRGGKYLLDFVNGKKFNLFFSDSIYTQDIYIPFEKPSNAEELAKKYMPVTIFHSDEEYFPQSLDKILSFQRVGQQNSINIRTLGFGVNVDARMGNELKTFMQFNGGQNYNFNFNTFSSTCNFGTGNCSEEYLFLRDLTGEINEAPVVYWDASIEGDFLYISYWYFYAFDPKLGSRESPDQAAHAFDRESVVIKFSEEDGQYRPKEITYAGHLEEQEIFFKGCNDFATCLVANNNFFSWKGGKTKLAWENALKVGRHPLVYKAQGAHAIYPTIGWYNVRNKGFNETTLNLEEPAGSIVGSQVLTPPMARLEKLDYANLKFLSFSGGWVDLLVGDSAKFPPFTRLPYGEWFADKQQNTAFDACFGNSNCGEYFSVIRGLDGIHAITIEVLDESSNALSKNNIRLSGSDGSFLNANTDLDGIHTFFFRAVEGVTYSISSINDFGEVFCENSEFTYTGELIANNEPNQICVVSEDNLFGAISGTIRSEESAAPLEGVIVEARMNDVLVASAVSDVDGIYEIDVPNGSYEISLIYNQQKSVQLLNVEVLAGEVANQDFVINTNAVTTLELVINGMITDPEQTDEYDFELTAGESLHFRITDINTDPSFSLEARLFNPDGTLLAVYSDGTTIEIDCFSGSNGCDLTQTGTYKLIIAESGSDAIGDYEIRYAKVSETNENGALVNDATVSGDLTLGDIDSFVFDATAGDAVHIRITDIAVDPSFSLEAWLYYPDSTLQRFYSDGTTIEIDCFSGSNGCDLTQTGTYKLIIAESGSDAIGDYEIRYAKVSETNENGALVNDAMVSGDLTLGDIDSFVFDATAGDAVHIRITDIAVDPSFSLEAWLYYPDSTLQRFYSDGTTIEIDCFSGSNGCDLTQTGTYKLIIAESGSDAIGDYEIRYAKVSETNENGALVNDAMVSGDLTLGDIDSFVFDATAGDAVHIRITDIAVDPSFSLEAWLYYPDSTLQRFYSDGTTIEIDCFSGSNGCDLTQTGTYKLIIAESGSDAIGDYEIRYAKVSETNENGALVNDATVSGDLTLGDIDSFVFDATAGDAVHIRITDIAVDPSFSLEAWLYYPDSTLQRFYSDGTTIEIDCFSGSNGCDLTQTGTYKLIIAESGSNAIGDYEIRYAKVSETNENGALVNDAMVSGDLTLGDIDSFVFDATAGDAVHIRITDIAVDPSFSLEAWLYYPDSTLQRFYSDGTTIEIDCFSGSNGCDLTQTGTYKLIIAESGSDAIGDYEIRYAKVSETNENGALVNDATVSGDLTLGDIDSFVFDATAGDAVYIRITDIAVDPSFSLEAWLYYPDSTLQRFYSDGTTIEIDCFSGSNGCDLTQTGTYKLIIAESGSDAIGDYEILTQ